MRFPGEVRFGGRLALQQRVLPAYRVPFFDLLAKSCHGGLSVFAGEPRKDEMIRNASHLIEARWAHAENVHLLAGAWYLLWQKQIISWLKTFDPDTLILEANPRYLSNRVAMTWMHNRGRPVIGWALGAPQVKGLLAGVRGWLRKRYLLRFDALIAYSHQGADEYKAIGFPENRIFIAYNAVSPAPIARPNRQSFRGRELHILFVGRLQDRKRIDMLLDVCARLSRQPELVIVGDGPAREYFESLAADIYPKARFIGSAYGDELNRWFDWADLFVLPGTGGLAVQQAMAAGLPVIVAQGDGTQNDLVSAQNGWLVPPGDNDRLLQVLSTALQDPELLIEMGRKSFEMSVQRFNIEMMVKVFLETIESVLRA
jgi:glycosyltransferase involved in cell wall biosynthesis